MKISIAAICVLLLLGVNSALAKTYQLEKRLDNYCSAGLGGFSFTCGNPDLGYFNGQTDLNNNGIYDILEVGRTFTIDLALPPPPEGFEYRANGPATIRLDTFGDLDSYPDLPPKISDIRADEHYDVEWIEVALDGYSLGRIFDGNLANDAFNMGLEQDWWGDNYDRGTLWGDGSDSPLVVYGHATIPQQAFSRIVADGKFSTSFGLSQDHNDLTGHPSFDDREEFIKVTLTFDADLVKKPGSPDQPPVARFSATPTSGAAPLQVSFDGSASSDVEGVIQQYRWTFGDGNQASGKKTSHNFTTPGVYNVELEVSDSKGQKSSIVHKISVTTKPPANTPPKAAFSFSPSSGAVKLTVTDEQGASGSTTKIIKVSPAPTPNQPPKAVIDATPATGTAPLDVRFSADRSSDSDGRITGWSWNFGDGASASSASATHRYTQAGTWPVTLTVTDDKGATSTATTTITVSAAPTTGETRELLPTADVGADDNFRSPTLFIEKWDHAFLRYDLGSINGAIESAMLRVFCLENAALESTVWAASRDDWNDNTATPAEVGYSYSGETSLATVSHNKAGYLDFDVTAFVRGELGGDKIASFEISNNKAGWREYSSKEGSAPPMLVVKTRSSTGTTNVPPVARFTVTPTSGPAPLRVNLDARAASDSDGSITSYQWELGDGTTLQGTTTSHRYTDPGTYRIRLSVTDNVGTTAMTSHDVTVQPAGSPNPPVAVASVDKTEAKTGQILQFSSSQSTAPGSSITQWRWTFGDGSSATTANPAHRYSAPGVYTVGLTITTANGKTATASLTVTIRNGASTPVQTLNPTDDLGATQVGGSPILFADAWTHLFLRFDLSQRIEQVGSATLRLYITSDDETTTKIWQARSDTWNEASGSPAETGYPWFDAPLIASRQHGKTGYLEFDISNLVRSEQTGDGVLSLEIGNTNGSWLEYASRESGHPPELIIQP